jgi:hypothetical protein
MPLQAWRRAHASFDKNDNSFADRREALRVSTGIPLIGENWRLDDAPWMLSC